MSVRVGINGLGRIGKGILSAWIARKYAGMEIVMVHHMTDPATYAHFLKYDSVHRTLGVDVRRDGNTMIIHGSKKIVLTAQPKPEEIPWKEQGVDIVLECTGIFTAKPKAELHRQQGVKKVIISAPAKEPDATIVMGVNDKTYDPANHHIVSNASCTTNCLAPIAKVLQDNFGIEKGLMTTIHSYTNDQVILDRYHKDLRRARAGALSMIPTTTGAAKAIGLVMPELKGKLDGLAIRVPTPNVSIVDLVVTLKKTTTAKDINEAARAASKGPLTGVLRCSDEPLVSIDFCGTRESSILDTELTSVIDGHLAKVLAWYDNETGFSNRMLDLATMMGKSL